MIPPDALIASLCQSVYNPTALIDGWDRFDPGLDDGICYGVRKLDGLDVVVFRGSITLQDWIRDLRAAVMLSRVGHVHIGFYAGMEHAWADMRPLLTQPVIVAGHSLGAARADMLCGLMVKDGMTPVRRVVLAEPKPGLIDFANLIKDIPAASYRNGDDVHHDLVTDLPFSFPPLEYVHPTPVIQVCAEPSEAMFDRQGAFAFHHVELYVTALAAQKQEA